MILRSEILSNYVRVFILEQIFQNFFNKDKDENLWECTNLLNSIFQISLTSLRSFIEGSESTVAVRNVNQLIPIAKTTTTHAKVHKDFLRLLVVTAIISATYSVHCTPYRITCLRKIVTNSDQNNEKKEFNYLYSIFAVFHLYFGLYTNRMCISNTWTLLFIILSIQLNNNRKQPKN